MSATDASPKKLARFDLRATEEDAGLIRQAAVVAGQSLSEFAVESMVVQAERVLAEQSRFVLDAKRSEQFHKIMGRPAVSHPKLRQLLSTSTPLDS